VKLENINSVYDEDRIGFNLSIIRQLSQAIKGSERKL
jgi:hypothetical protein